MIYKYLIPEMRKEVRNKLKEGQTTVEEIRHNIRVGRFVEDQDEILAAQALQDKVRELNQQLGYEFAVAHFKPKVKVLESFWGKNKLYERSLEGELEYFLDTYEKQQNKKYESRTKGNN